MKQKYSPMMMQYLGIKEQNKDAIVMFRLGDFYEMFFDDAMIVSKELELALTGKNAGAKERVPMCGVPFHSASGYIQKLVDNGHKVAIVEQLTDPGKKGIVERGVVQIVTPGTIFDESLTQNRNNYIACMMTFDFVYTLAFCDITTGEFQVVNIDKQDNILNNQLATMEIKEIVVESNCTYSFHEGIMVSRYDNETFNEKYQDIFKNIKDLKQIKWPTTAEFNENSIMECPTDIPRELTVQYWFEKNDVENHPNGKECFVPRSGITKMLSVAEGDDSKKSYKRLHRWRYSPTVAYGNNEVHLHPYKARRLTVAEALALQSLPKNFSLPPKMSLTDKFKTIGNGVPFMLSSGIAKTIYDFMIGVLE